MAAGVKARITRALNPLMSTSPQYPFVVWRFWCGGSDSPLLVFESHRLAIIPATCGEVRTLCHYCGRRWSGSQSVTRRRRHSAAPRLTRHTDDADRGPTRAGRRWRRREREGAEKGAGYKKIGELGGLSDCILDTWTKRMK